MNKGWQWLAAGAIIGLVIGWLLLRRRRARPALPASALKPDEAREDRIVLPLSRPMPTVPRAAETVGGVKGEITLPGGRPLAMEAAPPGDTLPMDTPADEGSAASEPEDDRIELPLHGASAGPLAGELDGIDETPMPDVEVTAMDNEVNTASESGAGVPDNSVEAYCVRCKTQRPMVNVTQYVTSKNRAALKGECSVCGVGMFKFVKE